MQKYFYNFNFFKQISSKQITIKLNVYLKPLKVNLLFLYFNFFLNINIWNTKFLKNFFFNSFNFIFLNKKFIIDFLILQWRN